MEHVVYLLRHNSTTVADLATALARLSNLHLMMGKIRESEREDRQP